MSGKNISLFIVAVCIYIYVGVVVKFLNDDFPMIIIHLGALVGLIVLYAYTVVRQSKSYDYQMIAKLEAKHSYLCIGTSPGVQYAVGADPSGITIYRLAQGGQSIKSTLHMPYSDVNVVSVGNFQSLARNDRGAAVGIQRKSDGRALIMGMMEIDEARHLGVIDYLWQRATRNSRNGDSFVKKLMQPAEESAAAPTKNTLAKDDDGSATSLEDIASNYRTAYWVAFWGGLFGTILSVVLALATIMVFDPDIRREVTAPFTTCAGPASAITTVPVNKTIKAPGATITVKNVIYNVPQEAEQPQAYTYQCRKATLVQIETSGQNVTTDTADNEMGLFDFDLENQDDDSTGAENAEQYENYAESEELYLLEHSSFDETTTARGWLAFPVLETASNQDTVFTYKPLGGDIEKSISLPEPTQSN